MLLILNNSVVWCIKFFAGIAMLCMYVKQNVVFEPHAYRRRVAESFLINQKACSCNVINRNDGANFPTVYSVFVSNR